MFSLLAENVSLCIVSGERPFPAWRWTFHLLRSLLFAAGSVRLCWLGQDAVGSEGHLLCGGAGCRLTRVAGYHDHEIGVPGVAHAFGEDDSGVSEGSSVVVLYPMFSPQ